MREVKYYCDRCKKEVEYGYITELSIKDNSPRRKSYMSVNLCEQCYDEMVKFVNGKDKEN